MTAPFRQQKVCVADPLTAFVERCKAKAAEWQAGQIELRNAVDSLQQAAEALGLVIELGQDAMQTIMVDVFAPLRTDLSRDEYDGSTFAAACREAKDPHLVEKLRRLMDDDISINQAWDELNTRAPGDVPKATLDAAEYLAQQNDPERLRQWLDRHSAEERTAIRAHLARRACHSPKNK